jgi:RNA 2',3'-cyclic 3'-phosphodiesterase
MRLFVAVWPPVDVIETVGDAIAGRMEPGLRWVDKSKWHVTLDFLGSVPDDEVGDLVEAVARAGSTAPQCAAVLGPMTATLGRTVMCAPVRGLEDLAGVIRHATASFSRSTDRDRPFSGHLTLARAQRRGSIPRALSGIALSASWVVEEITVVSSKTHPGGAIYSTLATPRLAR